MTNKHGDIVASWPAPSHVTALCTSRQQGYSRGVYANGNFGLHVGDNPAAVVANRAILQARLPLNDIAWLEQVHGTDVVEAQADTVAIADGSYTRQRRVACAVMTADCLPLLLTDSAGTQVAAIHCGWRSLAAGIVATAVAKFSCPPADVLAWMGPAIGPQQFVVGQDVVDAFSVNSWCLGSAFKPQSNAKYLADIYALARAALAHAGVLAVSGGGYCTVQQADDFYSYRRDGVTGRMVSLIFLN